MFPNEDSVPESVTMSVLLVMAKSLKFATVSVMGVLISRVNSGVSSVCFKRMSKGVIPLLPGPEVR